MRIWTITCLIAESIFFDWNKEKKLEIIQFSTSNLKGAWNEYNFLKIVHWMDFNNFSSQILIEQPAVLGSYKECLQMMKHCN